ncbi:MAG TPA: serine/threonine-protein kinase [Thermoanaerobaculia bacterium]|nr:serine/threonine-protein kinase [Thermoanaerobaculia bacterium]
MPMARWFSIISFAIFAVAVGADSAHDHYREGLQAAGAREWQNVVAAMSRAIDADPHERAASDSDPVSYYPYYYRGIALFHLGELTRAARDLERTTGVGPLDLGSVDTWRIRVQEGRGNRRSEPRVAVPQRPSPSNPISQRPPSGPRETASPPTESTASAHPPAAVFTVDELLRAEGSVAFNTPGEMRLEESAVIQLLLDPSAISFEALAARIEQKGEIQTARVRISDTVEAKLAGSAFDIRAITPEAQAVSGEEPTEWRWEIQPREKGTQRLFLTLNAWLPSEGGASERRRTIRTFERTISVFVHGSPWKTVTWVALALMVLALLIIILLRRGSSSRSSSAESLVGPDSPRSAPTDSLVGSGSRTLIKDAGEQATAAGSREESMTVAGWAAQRPAVPSLAVGDVIADRYVILRMLGQGGMGIVHAAEDRELRGERVALKTMLPGIGVSDHSMERFRREIQYARRVAHPNVCRIFDLGQHRTTGWSAPLFFVTMELIDGITLRERVRTRGPFTEVEALPVLLQIAAGLDATHQAGLIHRDLKPANVMVTRNGERTVVMDFGLARLRGDASGEMSVTETGAMVGSPMYMAPEQLQDGAISPATDVYALGLILYEMLTGRRPVAAENAMSILASRLHEEPVPPSVHRPGISRVWEEVILRCLSRRPEDRYPTAGEVVRTLGSRLSDEKATRVSESPTTTGFG